MTNQLGRKADAHANLLRISRTFPRANIEMVFSGEHILVDASNYLVIICWVLKMMY